MTLTIAEVTGIIIGKRRNTPGLSYGDIRRIFFGEESKQMIVLDG